MKVISFIISPNYAHFNELLLITANSVNFAWNPGSHCPIGALPAVRTSVQFAMKETRQKEPFILIGSFLVPVK
ncbi:hypothetical protein P4666_28625 [Priestia megaterium]|nr:hypothetical protein [Priestia megaterium]